MGLKTFRVSLLTAACVTALSGAANAAGFYLQEQSVSGLGTAFAGAAADTPDSSTVYYNPANMTELKGPEIQFGANLLLPSADFDNRGSTYTGAGTGSGLIGGNDSGNPFDPEVLPQIYAAAPVSDKLWLGIGVYTPFGLANEYGTDFVGRYNSVDSELKTIDVQPTIAYRVNDKFSVGGGVSIQYVYANLKTAIPSPGLGGPGQITDGLQKLSGDDIGVGYNLGVQFRPTETTKIGLTYKTSVNHDLKGDVDVEYPISGLLGGLSNTNVTVDGKAKLSTPDIASLAVSQELNDRWTVLASLNWYGWSDFDNIPVISSLSYTKIDQNYKNTFGGAIGARYRLNDQWLLKAGIQYDQTPTVTSARSTRVPDGDRWWFAAGATYSLTPNIDLDFAGAFVNVEETNVDVTDVSATNVTTTTRGKSDGTVTIISSAIKYKF